MNKNVLGRLKQVILDEKMTGSEIETQLRYFIEKTLVALKKNNKNNIATLMSQYELDNNDLLNTSFITELLIMYNEKIFSLTSAQAIINISDQEIGNMHKRRFFQEVNNSSDNVLVRLKQDANLNGSFYLKYVIFKDGKENKHSYYFESKDSFLQELDEIYTYDYFKYDIHFKKLIFEEENTETFGLGGGNQNGFDSDIQSASIMGITLGGEEFEIPINDFNGENEILNALLNLVNEYGEDLWTHLTESYMDYNELSGDEIEFYAEMYVGEVYLFKNADIKQFLDDNYNEN